MSETIKISVTEASWPLRTPLRFAFAELNAIDVLTVELRHEDHRGRGEGIGVFFRGDSPEKGIQELRTYKGGFTTMDEAVEACAGLRSFAARNALDCAIWDLRCKRDGIRIHEKIGAPGGPVDTFQTISLDSPEVMAEAAASIAGPRLKLKVDAARIVEQVQAVRAIRPEAILLADANQDLDLARLVEVAPLLAEAGLVLLEQPLPAGGDSALAEYRSPVPLCADESCFTAEDVPALVGLYDAVNIKLDKAGGLTGGLALLRTARKHGLKVLVGCMAGTSLSMAPALTLASLCDFADLDGPLLLSKDLPNGVEYKSGVAMPAPERFWG
ncbi:dipeptide epimerase [Henriciella sp. AS95]|uniref:dipeptide epimerase n=1 Tax=Henriciella sp. AS95 TaxID=3135782 RepID=UPI00317CD867